MIGLSDPDRQRYLIWVRVASRYSLPYRYFGGFVGASVGAEVALAFGANGHAPDNTGAI